jgi:hypothetical protein
MDLGNESAGKVEAAAAPRGLTETHVDLARRGQPRGGCGADIAVAVTIADADVHAELS